MPQCVRCSPAPCTQQVTTHARCTTSVVRVTYESTFDKAFGAQLVLMLIHIGTQQRLPAPQAARHAPFVAHFSFVAFPKPWAHFHCAAQAAGDEAAEAEPEAAASEGPAAPEAEAPAAEE